MRRLSRGLSLVELLVTMTLLILLSAMLMSMYINFTKYYNRQQAEVDVLRGAGALESKLEREAALERRCITDHGHDACEKAVEYEKVSLARELGAGRQVLRRA